MIRHFKRIEKPFSNFPIPIQESTLFLSPSNAKLVLTKKNRKKRNKKEKKRKKNDYMHFELKIINHNWNLELEVN